jgi:molybdenum-dependent DNA-binding transcriptional regulator ModE
LVETRVGGQGVRRSQLTEPAKQIVGDFDALRQRMFDVVAQEFASHFHLPGAATRD